MEPAKDRGKEHMPQKKQSKENQAQLFPFISGHR